MGSVVVASVAHSALGAEVEGDEVETPMVVAA